MEMVTIKLQSARDLGALSSQYDGVYFNSRKILGSYNVRRLELLYNKIKNQYENVKTIYHQSLNNTNTNSFIVASPIFKNDKIIAIKIGTRIWNDPDIISSYKLFQSYFKRLIIIKRAFFLAIEIYLIKRFNLNTNLPKSGIYFEITINSNIYNFRLHKENYEIWFSEDIKPILKSLNI